VRGSATTAAVVARSTLAAAFGLAGGPFAGSGPVQHAELVLDDLVDLPSGTQLLQPGRRARGLVRSSPGVDDARIHTLSIKLPDLYGPGRDQDFLLASSADGVPMHHVPMPSGEEGPRLYSSLWLYLAGARPVLFGARGDPDRDGVVEFMLSDVIGRFRRLG
jgi:hypothetical protein